VPADAATAAAPRVLIACDDARALADRVAVSVPGCRPMVADTPAAALGAGAEIVFAIKSRAFDDAVHARLLAEPALRWLHVGGSGYEHLGAWDADRLIVTNSAGVLAPFLAETCMGALLALNHGLLTYRDQQRDRVWAPRPFRPLAGQTLAVIGMGEIGRRFGHLARAAGMRVIGLRRTQAPLAEADEIRPPEALHATLAEADIVSVHLRLTPETRHLFDAAAFAAMKPGAIFMNTGRGGLVDETALLAALDGPLGAAYLDVFETEPLPENSPLWTHPNLFLTPHASDSVQDWDRRFADFFAENLRRWQAGTPLLNRVRP